MPKVKVVFDVTVELEIAEEVFAAVTDEWRKNFYDLRSDADVAGHVARNVMRGRPLSRLDGWADMPDDNVKVVDSEWLVTQAHISRP